SSATRATRSPGTTATASSSRSSTASAHRACRTDPGLRCPDMFGAYVWPHSAAAGGTVAVLASGPARDATLTVTRLRAFDIEVSRTRVALSDHELPPEADAAGCDWPAVATITVEAGWPSGYYEVVVHTPDGGEAVAFLVVRGNNDAPLLVLSTNTWNAY